MSEDNAEAESALFEEIPEDEGVLQPDETLETDDLDEDPLDTGISPPERHPKSEGFGVTLAEARAGESLDQRLAQEEPDVGATGAAGSTGRYTGSELDEDEFAYDEDAPAQPRTGRLVAGDEGSHATDDPSYFVRDVGIDGGAAGAEEAAVHLIEEDDDDLAEGPEVEPGVVFDDVFDEDLDADADR